MNQLAVGGPLQVPGPPPELHQSLLVADGFRWRWVWLEAGCIAFMGGVLAKAFLRDLRVHPVLPLKNPRLSEAMGLYLVPTTGFDPESGETCSTTSLIADGGND